MTSLVEEIYILYLLLGSKMIPVWSWLQMGRDLLLIRLRYILGAWRINKSPKAQ
jgi:dolichyl-phosphate beta-glucosyltransferase